MKTIRLRSSASHDSKHLIPAGKASRDATTIPFTRAGARSALCSSKECSYTPRTTHHASHTTHCCLHEKGVSGTYLSSALGGLIKRQHGLAHIYPIVSAHQSDFSFGGKCPTNHVKGIVHCSCTYQVDRSSPAPDCTSQITRTGHEHIRIDNGDQLVRRFRQYT